MGRVDETKIIDREAEVALFGQMIRLEIPRRVMVVSDKSGMGKTDLLRKLRLQCERDYAVAVAFAPLEDFTSRQDEFALVASLHKALKATGASLPNFEELNNARGLNSTMAFLERVRSVAATVDMSNAAVTGAAKIAAMMINVDHADNVHLPPWNQETDTQARALCVEAFLADLITYAQQHPAALLFDSLDKIGEDLRRWILSEFVRKRALAEWQSRKLVVVLAGHGAADMVYGRLPENQHEFIEPIASFGKWTVAQVADFLKVNGYGDLQVGEINAIYELIKAGRPLSMALTVAATLSEERE